MPRSTKTHEERIENVKTEIRQGEKQINKLLQKNINAERNMRTSRLIQRGAILESMIKEAATLTNEQIKRLLYTAFKDNATVREMANAFRVENTVVLAAESADESDETRTTKAQ